MDIYIINIFIPSSDGTPWQQEQKSHHGVLEGTEHGSQGPIHVFVHPGATQIAENARTFVVSHVDPATGRLTSPVVMLGFESPKQAQKAYQANFPRDRRKVGPIREMPASQLRERVNALRQADKPASATSVETSARAAKTQTGAKTPAQVAGQPQAAPRAAKAPNAKRAASGARSERDSKASGGQEKGNSGQKSTGGNTGGSGNSGTNGGRRGPTGRFYSVAFQMILSPNSYPKKSRERYFQEANEALLQAMESDPEFAEMMRKLGVHIKRTKKGKAPRSSPAGWTWHHGPEPGAMQLVPRQQHIPGSIFQKTLHPGGKGGFFRWNK